MLKDVLFCEVDLNYLILNWLFQKRIIFLDPRITNLRGLVLMKIVVIILY